MTCSRSGTSPPASTSRWPSASGSSFAIVGSVLGFAFSSATSTPWWAVYMPRVISFLGSLVSLGYILGRDILAGDRSIGKKIQNIRVVTTSRGAHRAHGVREAQRHLRHRGRLGVLSSTLGLVPCLGDAVSCMLLPLWILGIAGLGLGAAIYELIQITQRRGRRPLRRQHGGHARGPLDERCALAADVGAAETTLLAVSVAPRRGSGLRRRRPADQVRSYGVGDRAIEGQHRRGDVKTPRRRTGSRPRPPTRPTTSANSVQETQLGLMSRHADVLGLLPGHALVEDEQRAREEDALADVDADAAGQDPHDLQQAHDDVVDGRLQADEAVRRLRRSGRAAP